MKKLSWLKLDQVKCPQCPWNHHTVRVTNQNRLVQHWEAVQRKSLLVFVLIWNHSLYWCCSIMNLFFWPTVQFFKFQKGWRKRLFLSRSLYSSFLLCSQHFQVKHIHNKDGPHRCFDRRDGNLTANYRNKTRYRWQTAFLCHWMIIY